MKKETSATKTEPDLPSSSEIESELDRVQYKTRYSKVLRSTVYTLITVAAVAVLVATIFLPVFQVYGMSMTPTLEEGEIIVSVKGAKLNPGDIVAFYFNNKILVKRVIANSGDWVNIDDDGNVFVNDVPLDEPYLTEKSLGECDIDLPYQVPEGRIFVMGDHRSISVDSRSTSCGPVSEEQIAGKIVFVVWPPSKLGSIK